MKNLRISVKISLLVNFTSFLFLFGFLPFTLVAYRAVHYIFKTQSAKNIVLLIMSFIFYAWGTVVGLPVLLLTSASDFLIAKKFDGPRRRLWLFIGITINLLCLCYFKYANFFIEQSNEVLAWMNITPIPWSYVILPAGISFFTFEKISYLLDVYHREVPPSRKFSSYLLFVTLFPHLIAGPILKYKDLRDQIEDRDHHYADLVYGFRRFIFGLAKKVLIADVCARTANIIFDGTYAAIPTQFVLLGVIAYSFQIYFDFSGYSDMAIGLARMFGFRFNENFNNPYLATSITDFWKRWHISLTNWMREYLYIPLGGNRLGTRRTYLNLVLVFLLSGLWHGAQWTFIAWGVGHGILLLVERFINSTKQPLQLPRSIQIIGTFIIVSLLWVVFRAHSITDAFAIYKSIFTWQPLLLYPISEASLTALAYPEMVIQSQGVFILLVGIFIIYCPKFGFPTRLAEYLSQRRESVLFEYAVTAVCLIFFLACLGTLAESNYSPFLYFRF